MNEMNEMNTILLSPIYKDVVGKRSFRTFRSFLYHFVLYNILYLKILSDIFHTFLINPIFGSKISPSFLRELIISSISNSVRSLN